MIFTSQARVLSILYQRMHIRKRKYALFHLNHTSLSVETPWNGVGSVLKPARWWKGNRDVFLRHHTWQHGVLYDASMEGILYAPGIWGYLNMSDITKPMALWIWWLPRLFKKILGTLTHCIGPPEKVLWQRSCGILRLQLLEVPAYIHTKKMQFILLRAWFPPQLEHSDKMTRRK